MVELCRLRRFPLLATISSSADLAAARGAAQPLLPSALALSPVAPRQRGSALYLATAGILHDGEGL